MDERFACDRNSIANANVKVQIKETDNTEKANKCYQCDYSTSHAGDLRKHLKTHSGQSVHAIGLRVHLKTHSGEKLNKCNQCDVATSQASDLRTHLTMHSGEKQNTCNQCDFASSQTSNLRRRGEKLYKCKQFNPI